MPSNAFSLGLAQCGYPTDQDVLRQAESFATDAKERGVDLLVFPENLMHPRQLGAEELRGLAQTTQGEFAQEMGRIAARHNLWIVFTMNETNPAGGPPFNTAIVVDSTGVVRGTYRKCHLYDAHGIYESDRMTAGDTLCSPIATSFCTLGIGICYDLRFPEAVRNAAASCDVILFPAAWHDGPHKPEHWETLIRARAIENECYVAGICHAGNGFVEKSMVAGPLGNVVAQAPAGESLLVAHIDPATVAEARRNMPVFAHRRPALYVETGM